MQAGRSSPVAETDALSRRSLVRDQRPGNWPGFLESIYATALSSARIGEHPFERDERTVNYQVWDRWPRVYFIVSNAVFSDQGRNRVDPVFQTS